MNKTQVLYERNKLVVKLLWFSLFLAAAGNIARRAHINSLIAVILTGMLCSGISTFMTYKRLAEKSIKYVVTIGLALISFSMLATNPNIAIYIVLYFSLSIVTLYHDFVVIILSGVLNVILSNYTFIMYKDTMFQGDPRTNITLNIFLITITIILAYQTRIGTKMRKDAEEAKDEALKAKQRIEVIIDNVKHSINESIEFGNILVKDIDITKAISGEIVKT